MRVETQRFWLSAVGSVAVLLAGIGTALADIVVDGLVPVSSSRVSRFESQFVYQVRLRNDGNRQTDVAGTLSSTSAATSVVDSSLDVGTIEAGESLITRDTVTIRQDRRRAFDPAALQWVFLSGSASIAEIGPAGGTVELEGVAAVTFPAGSFLQPTTVSVVRATDPQVGSIFDETSVLFRVGPRLEYEVLINAGPQPILSSDIQLELAIPQSYLDSLPGGSSLDVFALLTSGNAQDQYDYFELFPGEFDSSTNVLSVTLPTQVFANTRNASGLYEATIVVAPTPGVR